MIANIEEEYTDFVCNAWQEISDVTKDSLELHQEPEHTYNIIALGLIQFLQGKLEGFEIKNS